MPPLLTLNQMGEKLHHHEVMFKEMGNQLAAMRERIRLIEHKLSVFEENLLYTNQK